MRTWRSKEKKEEGAEKKTNKLLGVFFWILLAFCLVIVLSKLPLFDIDKVEVSGNYIVGSEEILSVSGIDIGENIFEKSFKNAKKRIEALPYINNAKLIRKLPSKVLVEISEEAEAAFVVFESRTVAVDKNGKSIRLLQEGEELSYTLYSGIDDTGFREGQMILEEDDPKLKTLRRCIDCIKTYEIRNVRHVNLFEEENVIFNVGDALTLKIGSLGTEDELSYKMAYVKEVMDNLPDNISGIIDATNVEEGITYRATTEEERQKEDEKERANTPLDEGNELTEVQ